MNVPVALAGQHEVLPLPFDAASLEGLSEKLIVSHHQNNYAGAVRNLNKVEKELAALDAEAPAFVVTALRERELTFRASKQLHEAYFSNLGGDGKVSGPTEAALRSAYGSTAKWEQHMRATAAGLGGGSGWALLVYELETGGLRTVSSGNHAQGLSLTVPLIALDMYEHSYHMDYGTSAAAYVDAFFRNLLWSEVERRFERAQAMSKLLRGGAA